MHKWSPRRKLPPGPHADCLTELATQLLKRQA